MYVAQAGNLRRCELRQGRGVLEMRKQKIKPYKKLLYIEDGSVDLDYIYDLHIANPEIFIIIYRQGSIPPTLVDIRSTRNEKHKF